MIKSKGEQRASQASRPNHPIKKSKIRPWLWFYLLMLLLGWSVIAWIISSYVHRSSIKEDGNFQKREFQKVPRSREASTKNEFPPAGKSGTASLLSPDQQLLVSYVQGDNQEEAQQRQVQEVFAKEMVKVQEWLLQQSHHKSLFLPLTAYLESPLPPYNDAQVPRLDSSHRLANKPQGLIRKEFSNDNLQTCRDLPNAFPIQKPLTDKEEEEQAVDYDCPIHADPFLPWIHDAFVSQPQQSASDQQQSQLVVEIIAHNQRRCHTNPKQYMKRLQHLEPQVTLMQSVPVIAEKDKRGTQQQTRYRLASLKEAAGVTDGATETRFICHFHTPLLVDDDNNNDVATSSFLQTISLGETLSVFPYNYEHANYQKRNSKPLLTRATHADKDDKKALHNEQVWNSLLHFQCPIPEQIQTLLATAATATAATAKQDATATGIYLDVIPIRTYPRIDRDGYFDRMARNMSKADKTFDPKVEWGIDDNKKHWLPSIEQSGRWTNIPLCPIPTTPTAQQGSEVDNHKWSQDTTATITSNDNKKRHYLAACVWASATFTTRGSSEPDTSTSERLLEWLTYQFQIAKFDHVYIYDNTPPYYDGGEGSNSNANNVGLEPVTRLFPSHQVTRIPWKHPVCNNNRPGSADPGERSSQYAAEASCRVRYGPTTEWLAVLDTDEYLIPQQQHQQEYYSLRQWLQQASKEYPETKIWSFYQTRAIPNRNTMEAVASSKDPQYQWKKRSNTTFLETYNCDRLQFPKPGWAWRAKKQIFQPSYVLMHFVHYSLVTRRLLDAPTEMSGLYNDFAPRERRVDERKQAFLLHAKTTSPQGTQYWKKQCPVVTTANDNGKNKRQDKKKKEKKSNDCPIGIPFPPGAKEGDTDTDGREYNCYPHQVVTDVVVPRLRVFLRPLLERYHQSMAKQ